MFRRELLLALFLFLEGFEALCDEGFLDDVFAALFAGFLSSGGGFVIGLCGFQPLDTARDGYEVEDFEFLGGL